MGVSDQLHGGVVHVDVVQGDIRVFLGDLDDHLPPEHHGGQHIGLVHRGDELAAQPSGVKGAAGDALDLPAVVDHGVVGFFGGAGTFPALGLAEVDVAGELAHAEDVKAVPHDIGAQGAGRSQGFEDLGRAEVAEELEMFSKRQQGGALRLLGRGQGFPFGAAHRAEEDGVAGLAHGKGRGGQGLAVVIDGAAAHIRVFVGKAETEFLLGRVQNLDRFPHDFRADAVAGQDCYLFHLAYPYDCIRSRLGRREGDRVLCQRLGFSGSPLARVRGNTIPDQGKDAQDQCGCSSETLSGRVSKNSFFNTLPGAIS